MTITMYEGYDKSYVILDSKDRDFQKQYGCKVIVPTSNIYKELADISKWCNNVICEECLFEVD